MMSRLWCHQCTDFSHWPQVRGCSNGYPSLISRGSGMRHDLCQLNELESTDKQEAFQYDAYRPRCNKDEQWPSSHEANCEQNDTRLWKHYLPLRSVIMEMFFIRTYFTQLDRMICASITDLVSVWLFRFRFHLPLFITVQVGYVHCCRLNNTNISFTASNLCKNTWNFLNLIRLI